ncbi:ankyrin repeat-containing domain protein [Nemania abortiva]|nr:ankyrin repeat-containing domain protein [Nemania abortiva]
MPRTSTEDIHILVNPWDENNDKLHYSFCIENSLERNLHLVDVIPRSSWDRENDRLTPNDETKFGRVQRFWARFRSERDASDDFVLVLELISQASDVHTRHHVMTCYKGIELDDIKRSFAKIDSCDLNKHYATNGMLNLEVALSRERAGMQDMFVVRLLQAEDRVGAFNVSNTIYRLRHEQEAVSAWKQYYHREDLEAHESLIERKRYEISSIQTRSAALQEKINALQEEQSQLQQMEEVATSDLANLQLESHGLKERNNTLLKEAQALQDHFDKQFETSPIADRMMEDCNSEDPEIKRMQERIHFQDHHTAEGRFQFIQDLKTAAEKGYELPFRQLAKRNVDIRISTDDKGTRLIVIAAREGHKQIVQTLLFLGTYITYHKHLLTAFVIASAHGYVDIVRLLLDYGVPIDNEDSNGWTALTYAVYEGREAMVQVLLEHGAEIENKNSRGWTALILAASKGRESIARVLLEDGASISNRGPNGWTALIYAAYEGYEAIVRLLLEHGAELEAQASDGSTALMHAAYEGHGDIVKLLLESGASKETTDNFGSDARDWAERHGRQAIVLLLDVWDAAEPFELVTSPEQVIRSDQG